MNLENTIIYLIGFPGTGKYTIAKELAEKLPNARLVDNHLINNVVFGLIDKGRFKKIPEEVWVPIRKVRNVVMDVLKTLTPPEFNLVFTNVLFAEDENDQNIFDSIMDVAKQRKAVFVPIRLHCDPEENARRVASEGRAERMKLTDPKSVMRWREEECLIDISHKNLLDLDVTHLSPPKAAEEILNHIKEVC